MAVSIPNQIPRFLIKKDVFELTCTILFVIIT